jgi:hypothetical protein
VTFGLTLHQFRDIEVIQIDRIHETNKIYMFMVVLQIRVRKGKLEVVIIATKGRALVRPRRSPATNSVERQDNSVGIRGTYESLSNPACRYLSSQLNHFFSPAPKPGLCSIAFRSR